jgi:hypothetical protein
MQTEIFPESRQLLIDEINMLRRKRDATHQEYAEKMSEIVSDAIDPSVNVQWMRCSPDLPAYVKGLESEIATLKQSRAVLAETEQRVRVELNACRSACAEMREALDELMGKALEAIKDKP